MEDIWRCFKDTVRGTHHVNPMNQLKEQDGGPEPINKKLIETYVLRCFDLDSEPSGFEYIYIYIYIYMYVFFVEESDVLGPRT